MNPPEKLEEMFIYYDQIVQEYIKRGDLNKNDAIYPALIFKEQLTRAEEPRYLFVVPGKDPWPDPKRFKVMIETLHAYEAQIRLIMSKLYSPNRNARLATAQEFEQLRPVLQDRVARIEVALYHGVKLGITPAQIIHDSTPDYVSKGSKTYQFFESFAPPKSRTWAAFVSAWAAK